jgi:hypothetical protein
MVGDGHPVTMYNPTQPIQKPEFFSESVSTAGHKDEKTVLPNFLQHAPNGGWALVHTREKVLVSLGFR